MTKANREVKTLKTVEQDLHAELSSLRHQLNEVKEEILPLVLDGAVARQRINPDERDRLLHLATELPDDRWTDNETA